VSDGKDVQGNKKLLCNLARSYRKGYNDSSKAAKMRLETY